MRWRWCVDVSGVRALALVVLVRAMAEAALSPETDVPSIAFLWMDGLNFFQMSFRAGAYGLVNPKKSAVW